MADSTKSTVVVASILKPVDDSRMFEKIGLTLAGSGKFEVHVIGQDSEKPVHSPVIQHGLKPFHRISTGRLLAPWRIFLMARRISPDVFVVTTHELLYTALLLKAIRKCRLIYDVQENYYWNILYTPAFPLLLKPFVALYVRCKEFIAARFIDHFLLAEIGYRQELKFPGNRFTVIENKVRLPESGITRPEPPGKTIQLLFTGTLAETTGIFTAIDLAIRLHVIDDRIRLTIIGFSSRRQVIDKVRLLIQPRPFIELITRDRPIPHQEIFAHIRSAHFGLITYEVNPSTMNSIPTKMYEYLGFKLPVVLVNHKPWVEFCAPYHAAVTFDAAHYDAAVIYESMMHSTFYTSEPSVVYWHTEEPKLLDAMDRLLTA